MSANMHEYLPCCKTENCNQWYQWYQWYEWYEWYEWGVEKIECEVHIRDIIFFEFLAYPQNDSLDTDLNVPYCARKIVFLIV